MSSFTPLKLERQCRAVEPPITMREKAASGLKNAGFTPPAEMKAFVDA
jgi:hypothetical protein